MSKTKRYLEAIEDYANARDNAILDSLEADSVEPFKQFIADQRALGILPKCFVEINDEALAIAIRRMSLHCLKIPTQIKGESVEWLTSRGLTLDIVL